VDADLAAVEEILSRFVAADLMFEEDGFYLSLAVPVRAGMESLFSAVTRLMPREQQATPSLPVAQ
jgi:hypothetical protein